MERYQKTKAFEFEGVEFTLRYPSEINNNFEFVVSSDNPYRIILLELNNYIKRKDPPRKKIIERLKKKIRNKFKREDKEKEIKGPTNKESDFDLDLSREKEKIQKICLKHISNNNNNNQSLKKSKGKPQMFNAEKMMDVLMGEYIELWSILKKNQSGTVCLRDKSPFKWVIKLNNPVRSVLDLAVFEKKYGYRYVEININISEKYHPMEPPTVHIVRPRFKNSLMSRIANSKKFSTEHWIPSTTIKDVVNYVSNSIKEYGKIDLVSKCNNLTNYPDGAYERFEVHMLELSSLVSFNRDDIIDTEFMNQTILKRKERKNSTSDISTESQSKDYNSLGTGYGNAECKQWDRKKYLKMMQDRKKNVRKIIKNVMKEMIGLSDEIIYQSIKDSILINHVAEELKESSLMSIENDKETSKMFHSYFDLINYMCRTTGTLTNIITNKRENICSIYESIKNLNNDCKYRLDDGFDGSDVVTKIMNTFRNICSVLPDTELDVHDTPKSTPMGNITNIEYFKTMRKYVFRKCKSISNYNPGLGPKDLPGLNLNSRKRIESLSSELPTLKKDLLANFGCTGLRFYLMDKSKYKLRVMLVGVKDTPYENGSFIFDVYAPPEYKNRPPTVRMINCPSHSLINYNIYGNGNVCLSLLESYRGDPISEFEKWNAATSSIDQVMIAIQSSIFIETPYFNEQGHSRLFGTAEGMEQSKKSNNQYRYLTMKYMILQTIKDACTGMYPDFGSVILDHYKLEKKQIIKTCEKWCNENKHDAKYAQVLHDIKNILDKITSTC